MAWPDPEYELQQTMHTLQSSIAQATPEQRPVAITALREHLKEAKRRIGMYQHLLKLNEQEAQANAAALRSGRPLTTTACPSVCTVALWTLSRTR